MGLSCKCSLKPIHCYWSKKHWGFIRWKQLECDIWWDVWREMNQQGLVFHWQEWDLTNNNSGKKNWAECPGESCSASNHPKCGKDNKQRFKKWWGGRKENEWTDRQFSCQTIWNPTLQIRASGQWSSVFLHPVGQSQARILSLAEQRLPLQKLDFGNGGWIYILWIIGIRSPTSTFTELDDGEVYRKP